MLNAFLHVSPRPLEPDSARDLRSARGPYGSRPAPFACTLNFSHSPTPIPEHCDHAANGCQHLFRTSDFHRRRQLKPSNLQVHWLPTFIIGLLAPPRWPTQTAQQPSAAINMTAANNGCEHQRRTRSYNHPSPCHVLYGTGNDVFDPLGHPSDTGTHTNKDGGHQQQSRDRHDSGYLGERLRPRENLPSPIGMDCADFQTGPMSAHTPQAATLRENQTIGAPERP